MSEAAKAEFFDPCKLWWGASRSASPSEPEAAWLGTQMDRCTPDKAPLAHEPVQSLTLALESLLARAAADAPVRRPTLLLVVPASDRTGCSPFSGAPKESEDPKDAQGRAMRRQLASVAELTALGWLSPVAVVGYDHSHAVSSDASLWALLRSLLDAAPNGERRLCIHLLGLGNGADRLIAAVSQMAQFHLDQLRRPDFRPWFDRALLIGASAETTDDCFQIREQLPNPGLLLARTCHEVHVIHARDDRHALRSRSAVADGRQPLALGGARDSAARNVRNRDWSGRLGAHDDAVTAALCQFDLLGELRSLLLDRAD